jgi:diguanylate cyclase (GGDEF)-like protein
MVAQSLRSGTPFSIVICDIDRFKQVNDVFGHQAGDEALVNFTTLLRQFSREGDLVARYGGEEFVLLFPDCDNALAARRAEEIRHELSRTPQPTLGSKYLTASFGVTEVQMGDTPETMLRRADRALYQAKDGGRNRVVQLGAGLIPEEDPRRRNWLSWWHRRSPDCLLARSLVAHVPINVLVEKIKGFISDHGAAILQIDENYVVLELDGESKFSRRQSDRPWPVILELKLHEPAPEQEERTAVGTRTIINVTIRPKRSRDRRRQRIDEAAQIVASLKSYLIAQDFVGL